MFRMFIGMIIGAVMAIYAADGPATADQILSNAQLMIREPQSISFSKFIFPLIVGGLIWKMWKKRIFRELFIWRVNSTDGSKLRNN